MDEKEIAGLLDDADINASGGWEVDFVDSVRWQHAHGEELSERQLEKLTAIARGVNSTRHVRY